MFIALRWEWGWPLPKPRRVRPDIRFVRRRIRIANKKGTAGPTQTAVITA